MKLCPARRVKTGYPAANGFNGSKSKTCLGGCDYCFSVHHDVDCDECRWLCCNDINSAFCLSHGKQQNSDYAKSLNKHCPGTYAYSYDARDA